MSAYFYYPFVPNLQNAIGAGSTPIPHAPLQLDNPAGGTAGSRQPQCRLSVGCLVDSLWREPSTPLPLGWGRQMNVTLFVFSPPKIPLLSMSNWVWESCGLNSRFCKVRLLTYSGNI
ncbi:hypothetical protein [Microcoleus sp. FACHB-672]|uniref:hypothetical protein n=1 Tax=Microcoleus sp. FACHB-672 TaxID=2692825 RepID=UPI001682A491|nr:hypothetical protein [Microcoleus sp. FACHB-672]MBD2043218.1 hypothetical protein [Microcoleus sp. FACHB-672]